MSEPGSEAAMRIDRFTLFLDDLAVEAEIGIHDFERNSRQRLLVSVEVEVRPSLLPVRDDIAATLDYDWIRDMVHRLVAERRYDLQETLCRAILEGLAQRKEIVSATVETKKPDVYPDARAVGCRLLARRPAGESGQV